MYIENHEHVQLDVFSHYESRYNTTIKLERPALIQGRITINTTQHVVA